MAQFQCPTCSRNFGEAGFCPHDGVALKAVGATMASAPTYLDPDEFGPVVVPAPRAKFATADVVTEVDPHMDAKAASRPAVIAEQIAKAAQAAHEAKHARGRNSAMPFAPTAQAPAQVPPPSVVTSAAPIAQVLVSRDGVAAAAMGAPFSEYDGMVGTTLDGRYKLARKVGEGAMGVVFAANHNVIERPLALKILRRGYARDPKIVERFLREAKAASRIGHPNIVEVTDFGRTGDGMAYAVMEFLAGETLNVAIAREQISLARALGIALQIAKALGAAHAKGVIHRDLKSENIFLIEREGRRDFVKVVDFGVAKLNAVGEADPQDEPRLTLAGSIMGTPEYMAPEQAAGKTDVDQRVDIYSLGIILYEMIAGRLPFRGESLMRTLAMQIFDPMPPLASLRPGVPIELVAIVERACDKQPAQRFASMDEFAAALQRVSAAVAVTAGAAADSRSMRLPAGMAVGQLPLGSEQLPTLGAADASANALAVAQAQAHGDGRSSGGSNRGRLSDPAFVARKKPVTIDSLSQTAGYDEEEALRGGRLGLWLTLILALGLGVGAWAWLGQRGGATAASQTPDAAPGPLALVPSLDAGGIVIDAGAAAPTTTNNPIGATPRPGKPTSGQRVPATQPAGTLPVAPADVPVAPVATAALDPKLVGKKISIRVYSNPDGGNIYLDRAYRGPSGVTIQLPYGTRGMITCQMFGFAAGAVAIAFDGKTESIACPMIRLGGCVEDIKNPYDKCPDAGPVP